MLSLVVLSSKSVNNIYWTIYSWTLKFIIKTTKICDLSLIMVMIVMDMLNRIRFNWTKQLPSLVWTLKWFIGKFLVKILKLLHKPFKLFRVLYFILYLRQIIRIAIWYWIMIALGSFIYLWICIVETSNVNLVLQITRLVWLLLKILYLLKL